MPGLDPYHISDNLDAALLDVIVMRLEARGKHPTFQGMLEDYVDAMDIDSASNVLDIGCGTGVAARQIARRENFSGKILGIDQSPYLISVAERLAAEEHIVDRAVFQAGDSQGLALGDNAFDAVVAHTLISHVGDPVAVLSEMKRVTKSGGVVGVFDGDYASLSFELDDEAKSKADEEKLIKAIITQPRVMRQLPRLARKVGLDLVKVFPYVLAEVGEADFWRPAIESFRKLVPQSGEMTELEAEGWANALIEASETHTFFGAGNYYGYVFQAP